jgi:CRT-like, chloroquine-resistance transporter-like
MALSSVYKEIALGEAELDPIYLNGWVAVFQFAISIPLALPAALAGSPPVMPKQLPESIWDGE